MSIKYAVILAIASPSHVSGLTKSRPHAMLPVLGKPMVVRVMNQLLQEGIKKFVVIVGINEGSVASYLNANWAPDVEIDFVLKSDYESLSFTLAQVARKLNEAFFIVNYNTFTQPQFISTALSLAENHPESLILAGTNSTLSQTEHNAYATMEGADVGEILSARPTNSESSQLIANMAVCGMHFVTFLQDLPRNVGTGSLHQQFIDILHIYANFSGHRIMLGRTAWIMQVNSDRDLMLLNYQFLEEGRDAHILSELPPSVHVNYPVRIDPGVSIGHDANIGPFVYLESGASIGNGASIRRSMVLERASIPPDADIEDVVVSSTKIISSKIN